MEQIYEALKEVLASRPYKLVLSSGKGCEYQKIVVANKDELAELQISDNLEDIVDVEPVEAL